MEKRRRASPVTSRTHRAGPLDRCLSGGDSAALAAVLVLRLGQLGANGEGKAGTTQGHYGQQDQSTHLSRLLVRLGSSCHRLPIDHAEAQSRTATLSAPCSHNVWRFPLHPALPLKPLTPTQFHHTDRKHGAREPRVPAGPDDGSLAAEQKGSHVPGGGFDRNQASGSKLNERSWFSPTGTGSSGCNEIARWCAPSFHS